MSYTLIHTPRALCCNTSHSIAQHQYSNFTFTATINANATSDSTRLSSTQLNVLCSEHNAAVHFGDEEEKPREIKTLQ